MNQPTTPNETPGEHLDMAKMPGHWALARIGKRVLRPGGLELTRQMLAALKIGQSDHVVEFAPGLGMTAQMALQANPASYTAVERDEVAARRVAAFLTGSHQRCVVGSAEKTGLETGSATVVYGEAMLTMQTSEQKRRITGEAARLLQTGGRYAIHEISLTPDDIDSVEVDRIESDLGAAIRAGVRPLRRSEWAALLESQGLTVETECTSGFHLLEPKRLIQDEGIRGAMRIAFNVLRDRQARRRLFTMRRAIRKHAHHLAAIMMMGVKL